jgi:major membrane immunogen (membrane-anchored lipoprotein)
MKFLYVDVKKGKLVGVFNNVAGNIKYLSADDIEVQKDKHQALNRINTVKEFDDALVAMQNHDSPKKLFKMYNPLKGMFKKK